MRLLKKECTRKHSRQIKFRCYYAHRFWEFIGRQSQRVKVSGHAAFDLCICGMVRQHQRNGGLSIGHTSSSLQMHHKQRN